MANVALYEEVNKQDQNTVVIKYATMVKRIAHHVAGRLPSSVQVDDLIQAGMMGLLEAHKNYDSTKGASFDTYAGIRIRGTMLDEVRRNDWLPRSVYKNSRSISQAVQKVENRTGRDAKDSDVASEMQINLDEYHQLLRETNSGQLYGFDDLGLTDDVIQQGFATKIVEPMDGAVREDFYNDLVKAIKVLPEREQLVLSLYYDQELNLKEIGQVLEVSESRVCQIHSQAMHRLKARLPEWDKNLE